MRTILRTWTRALVVAQAINLACTLLLWLWWWWPWPLGIEAMVNVGADG